MRDLPDKRALSMPDVPFSAYCKVCWQNIYCMWVDKTPHDGSCIEGATTIGDCKQAVEWERSMGRIKSYLKQHREK